MPTFRFRLDKVLEWYNRQYEAEERRLAVCLAALADAHKAIAHLQAERISIERDVVSRPSIPARDFVALGLYRLRAAKEGVELDGQRDGCQTAVAEQQARLRAAERRVRLLEKLRERRAAEHTYAETRELEELASDAYFAKWAAR
jgi:hypothetical protein